MRKPLLLLAFAVTVLVIAGCSSKTDEPITAPQLSTQAISIPEGGFGAGGPQYFYTFATNHDPVWGVFCELEKIDLRTGAGTIGPTIDTPLIDFNNPRGIASPLGLCFDQKGDLYTIVNWLMGSLPTSSRLAKMDMNTGAVTWIGDYYDGNMTGPVADGAGRLYGTGFSNGPNHEPPDWFVGDQNLYRIDKATGVRTIIGDTGLRDIMDLAFDARGRLYATTMNKLYILSTVNGSSREVADITGVPKNACGIQLEVMSIDFDSRGVLYGTAIEGFATACFENTPFMRIDPKTGAGTVIGWTGQWYNHGGAIFNPRPPL